MPKVTSKLQVTIPKRLAEQYGITPGDRIEFVPAGDSIRLETGRSRQRGILSSAERLRLFDEATARQRVRDEKLSSVGDGAKERDWHRPDLYSRGKPR